MARLILKKDRDDSVKRRHPWVFSGAVARLEGSPRVGETVEVVDAGLRPLGQAAYSPSSQIVARFWTFGDQPWNRDALKQRLAQAIAARFWSETESRGGRRLVNAESDLLPGLIVDRYAEVLVCQFLTAGSEFWRHEIADLLRELVPAAQTLYERSDADVRQKEGLPTRVGLIWGEEPAAMVEIVEGGHLYRVDVRQGHKTGFYLDQRDNRWAVRQHLAELAAAGTHEELHVLNAFCYSGTFGVAAWKGGARQLTQVDASGPALELARLNAELNGIPAAANELIEGNVFSVLRAFRAAGRSFDAIVLDPPKFVESRSHLEKAARGYKDINHLAFQLLRPGGRLFTFSCSGLLLPDLFQKIVADAALDAGRPAQILQRLHAPADHPTLLAFPEGSYLKGLVCRVVA